MNLNERLERDNKKKYQKRKTTYSDDGEETLTYMERKRPAFLNEEQKTFSCIGDDSFHLAPSVFDKQAIFHTGKKQ